MCLLSLAVQHSCYTQQLDLKVAFLNGLLDEPVYMSFPQGYDVDNLNPKTHVLKLLCSLYGLKVSPKRWYERFRAILRQIDSRPYVFKPCNLNGNPRKMEYSLSSF